MNDIEILIKRMSFIEEGYLNNGHMTVGNFNDIDKAIELLKERQADKDRIKELETKYINPSKARLSYNNGKYCVVIEGFIPKSLIEEKIEWLKKIADNGANAVRFAATHDDEIERMQKQKDISTMISILQELLEESD